jgi:hypothetical protein
MLDMMIAKDNGLDLGVARTPQHAIDTPTTFWQWCEDTLKPAVQAARGQLLRRARRRRPQGGGAVHRVTGRVA